LVAQPLKVVALIAFESYHKRKQHNVMSVEEMLKADSLPLYWVWANTRVGMLQDV
jgi:hypothetical protein